MDRYDKKYVRGTVSMGMRKSMTEFGGVFTGGWGQCGAERGGTERNVIAPSCRVSYAPMLWTGRLSAPRQAHTTSASHTCIQGAAENGDVKVGGGSEHDVLDSPRGKPVVLVAVHGVEALPLCNDSRRHSSHALGWQWGGGANATHKCPSSGT